MVAAPGSTATIAVGNDLPKSGLFWRQTCSGKGGTRRLSNDSEEQTEYCFKIAYPNKGTRSWRIGHATLQQCVRAPGLEMKASIMRTGEKVEERPAWWVHPLAGWMKRGGAIKIPHRASKSLVSLDNHREPSVSGRPNQAVTLSSSLCRLGHTTHV
jgi:hypothetical protein